MKDTEREILLEKIERLEKTNKILVAKINSLNNKLKAKRKEKPQKEKLFLKFFIKKK